MLTPFPFQVLRVRLRFAALAAGMSTDWLRSRLALIDQYERAQDDGMPAAVTDVRGPRRLWWLLVSMLAVPTVVAWIACALYLAPSTAQMVSSAVLLLAFGCVFALLLAGAYPTAERTERQRRADQAANALAKAILQP